MVRRHLSLLLKFAMLLVAAVAMVLARAGETTGNDSTMNDEYQDPTQPLDPHDPLVEYENKQYPDIEEFHRHVDMAKRRQKLYSMPRVDRKTFEEHHERKRHTSTFSSTTVNNLPRFKNQEWESHRQKIIDDRMKSHFQKVHTGDEL